MAGNYDIGPKIGIDGEKEFRAQLRRINQEYAASESYIKALDKAMEQNGRSQEQLVAKSNMLQQQINQQQRKFEELYRALGQATEKYGAGSQEVLRFEGAILDVRNTVATLERELADTDEQLDKLVRGIDDVTDAADDGEQKILDFGDALRANIASGAILDTAEEIVETVRELGSAAIEAASEVKAENAQFSQTFGELEGTATAALESISDSAGIAVTRLQGGYTALYAFTKSVGGDSGTALDIAERAMRTAADSAAYYDKSLEDVTETLQSFLKGNYENDAALGIAATETTRNAKANELYAKSFNELTESQKVDTLLAMVEAGNAASGALGQAAREADSWSNVTGELAEAWRLLLAEIGGPVLEGVTPLLQGITEVIKGLTEKTAWQELREGIDGFREGLETADATLANSNASIAATAGLAQQYIDKLRALEEAGLNTADSQREYQQVVELLRQLYPELNLAIDNNTGLLNKNTEELELSVDALKRQAEYQAKQAYYAAIVEELTAVQTERYAAEMRLVELEAQEAQLLAQGAQVVDLYAAAQAEAAGQGALFWSTLSEQDKALYEVQLEMQATRGEISKLDTELANAEDQLDNATAAMGRMSENAKTAGYNTGAGVAQGIRESIPEVERAMQQLAKKGQAAYNQTMEIRSPARKMVVSGEYTGLGAVRGVENVIPDMEAAMRNLAQAGSAAYAQEQLMHIANYQVIVPAASGAGSSTTNNHTYNGGPITLNVTAPAGQDPRTFAQTLFDALKDLIEEEGAMLG